MKAKPDPKIGSVKNLSHFLATGFHDPYWAQKVLGHQNLRTTEIYLHDLDVDRSAANLFDTITHGLTHESENEAGSHPKSEKFLEKVKVRRDKISTQNMRELISTHEITHRKSSTNEKGAAGLP